MSETKWSKGEWISTNVEQLLPEKGVVVNTKIDDAKGVRNEAALKRGGSSGRLWFFPDGSMYVYYTPTHWQYLPAPPQEQP